MDSGLILKEIRKEGFIARMGYDEYSESPRRAYCNLGVIYSDFGYRHIEPDGHTMSELENEDGEITPERLDALGVWLPIRMYEHSGTAYWTEEGCGLPDARGVIIATWDKVRKEYPDGVETDEVKRMLSAEVEEYSRWGNGEVYMYEVESPTGEIVDRCGGYIGCKVLCMLDAESALDSEIQRYRDKLEETCEETAILCIAGC